ncbi:MAG: acyl-CoA dehydrogenase domain-containing protein, partial [Pseudomonas sp.]
LRWAMEESLGQAENALDRLLDNFPNRFVGCALRVLVFPFGRRHTGPSDELDAEVAALIGRCKGDPALEELLSGCFRPKADGDPVAALQRACDLLDETAPLRKALQRAIKEDKVHPAPEQSVIDAAVASGALQPGEGQRLQAAEQARRAVIDVDAFDKAQLRPEQGKVR